MAWTGLAPADLAQSIVDNYRTAKLNAEQLNALIEVTRRVHSKKLVRRFRNNGPMGSCCIIDFVAPSVDDGLAIDVGVRNGPLVAKRNTPPSNTQLIPGCF